MARLPRLVIPGLAHCLIQRGHGGRPVFVDDEDRAAYLTALREAAREGGVQLLAWALLDTQVVLLARPEAAQDLSRLMQSVGRRYVSAYNRRHGQAGTLWDGRFRCAPVEPGAGLLDLLAWVDGLADDPRHTSASLRLAGQPDTLLAHPPEFWALGNTPFEREAAYRRRLAAGTSPGQAERWRAAASGGWPIGSMPFVAGLAARTARPVRPRPPGRPRKAAAGDDGTPRA
jgi:putative transposase